MGQYILDRVAASRVASGVHCRILHWVRTYSLAHDGLVYVDMTYGVKGLYQKGIYHEGFYQDMTYGVKSCIKRI